MRDPEKDARVPGGGDTVTGAAPARRGVKVLVALCFVALVCDGYDLVVYGATVPSLLDYEPWSLTANQVGVIGSYTLMGMLVGAVSSGVLAARFGARRVYLGVMGPAPSPRRRRSSACSGFSVGSGSVVSYRYRWR